MPIIRVSKRAGGLRSRSMRGKTARSMLSYRLSSGARSYLKSILNPSYSGAKIPDSFGSKTCTIQLQREKRIEVAPSGSAQAGKIGGLMQLSIAPIAWDIGSVNSTAWGYDALIDGAPAYHNITGGAAGSKLPTLFRSARVVSAGIKVQFVGNTQNDQGTITVFAIDRPHMSSQTTVSGGIIGNPDLFGAASSLSSLSAANGDVLRSLPVNAFGPVRQGCTVRYYPVDDRDLEFHPYVPQETVSPANYAGCWNGTVGALGFLCEGLSTASGNPGSVVVQYTVNLECVVRDDSFNLVSSDSSPVDPKGLAAAATVYLLFLLRTVMFCVLFL